MWALDHTNTHTHTLAHIGAVTTKQSHIARVSLERLPLVALLRSATKHALNFLITPGYKSADARVRTEIRLWLRLPHTHTDKHTYTQTIYGFVPPSGSWELANRRPLSSFAQKLCKLMFT